jgi:hypothetical protein
LSLRGCRLLSSEPVSRGRSIKVLVPALAPLKQRLRLRGLVVRSGPAANADPGIHVMAVRFGDLQPQLAARLQAILDVHRRGPAVARRQDGARGRYDPIDSYGSRSKDASAESTSDTPYEVARDSEPTLDTEVGPAERRGVDRRSYDKRVVALGDEATRVLLGRDISPGGMRVDPNPGLGVGDQFKLALHAGAMTEPMVVRAVVMRDDGKSGLVLRFLDQQQRDQLAKLIDHLPLRDGGADQDVGMMISEILGC